MYFSEIGDETMAAKRTITPEQATAFLRHHHHLNIAEPTFEDLAFIGYHGIQYIQKEWLDAKENGEADPAEADFYIDLADALLEVATP